MRLKVTQQDAAGVALVLAIRGFRHLRARVVADYVLIETGPIHAPVARVRLRRIAAETWCIELKPDGRWETTSNVGPRGAMAAAVCDLFRQSEATAKDAAG